MSDVIPFTVPHGMAEIIAAYGDPKVTIRDGAWHVDDQWERRNLTMMFHPILPTGRLYCHRLIVEPTRRVFNRWQARIQAGDPYRVRHLGCFNPRAQRGSSGLVMSLHTLAIAWDLNPDQNPLVSPCELADPRRRCGRDIPDAWMDDARAEQFTCGADFQHRYDPQHFQLATGA